MQNYVIVEKEHFKQDFMPDKLIAREENIKKLDNKMGLELLPIIHVFGKAGTGKTLVVKNILKKENYNRFVYVNCWEHGTYYQIFDEILRHSQTVAHEKESRVSLLRKLKQTKKKIICLDEAEHIADIKAIPDLARHSVCLILISNKKHFFKESDRKFIEKIPREEIEFTPYKDEDILEILKDRARVGLRSGSYDSRLLSAISKICDGNARFAIQILGISAMKAEESKREKIRMEDVRYGAKCTIQHSRSYLLKKLNSHQKLLYEILKQDKHIPSGKLYREYQKNMKETVTDRCYRKYMKGLVKLDLAKEIGTGRWKKFEII